jgi:oxygen-independent coproporphyrinogen-3 oxidase
MTPDLALLAERRVPRYTSYPTVPHFTGAVTAETVGRWLEQTPAGTPLSLYLHIPFCRQVCWYCACNMKLAARPGPVLDYAERLSGEIALVAERLPGRMDVRALHWGGGTPTAMPAPALARLTERLAERFDIGTDTEIAFELDPRTFEPGMARALAAMGATRASLGVQEFDPAVQAAVNRVQPFEKVAEVVAELRGAGIAAINFDLMYGLPHQSVATIERTVELTLALLPDRIALFGYAHVPWMARNQRLLPEAALPRPADRFAQAEAAGARLEAAGYVRIGLDHFALPRDSMARAAAQGRLKRNFQGYTVDDGAALIGFGTTAISSHLQGYAQNLPETRAWGRAVDEGRLPVEKGLVLAPEDRLRREVIERLMCDLAVDTAALAVAHGARPDHFRAELGALRPLAAAGLCAVEAERVSVPGEARAALRVVAAVFDSYLRPSPEPRHSVAI